MVTPGRRASLANETVAGEAGSENADDERECIDGVCECTAKSCPEGCCTGSGCLPGDTVAACGSGGAGCETCADGTTCRDGVCSKCDGVVNCYYVSLSGSDANDGTSEASAWRTITHAASRARAGDAVYIKAGNYGPEEVVIANSGAAGNAILFQGVDGLAMIEGEDGPNHDQGSGTGLRITGDFVIVRNIKVDGYMYGIRVQNAEHVILDNVHTANSSAVANNAEGIWLDHTNNCQLHIHQDREDGNRNPPLMSFSAFYDNGFSLPVGTGNIEQDPLFADPPNGDFHERSRYGRWDGSKWVVDPETSPAIDAGDPASDFSLEPQPNGGRANMGAYGNTPEASKSPGGGSR